MKNKFAPVAAFVRAIAVSVIALVLIPATHLAAQTVTGTILGNVLDSSGAAVPNVQITIVNQDTGVVRNTIGTSDGIYNVPSLPAGKYTVDAKAPGFSGIQVMDVMVLVGSDTRADLKLQVGQVTQQVIVTEAVPTVETMSSEVASLMDEIAIESIPLNVRDGQQLAEIQAGVQFDYDDPNGKQLTVGGSRPDDNRYVNEGLDSTWTLGTSPLSTAGVILGVEAVKEFKVLTGEYSVEYGEQGGGVINTIYKLGTNSFHGSAYEYYRNSTFDALINSTSDVRSDHLD